MSETKTVTTLGDDLPRIIAFVRDEILPMYVELGPAGAFGAAMIRQDLDAASRAMISGDVVEMLRCYNALKETQ